MSGGLAADSMAQRPEFPATERQWQAARADSPAARAAFKYGATLVSGLQFESLPSHRVRLWPRRLPDRWRLDATHGFSNPAVDSLA